MHDVETHNSSAELLGVYLDLERHQTRITNSRHRKVGLGHKSLQRRESYTDRCLEAIIGHCTFFAIVQRAALATFHHVCSFTRKSFNTRAKMWPSARRELEFFCGRLPLLHADWRAPFSYMVNASDVWSLQPGAAERCVNHVACGREHAFGHALGLAREVVVRIISDAVASALPDYDSKAPPCREQDNHVAEVSPLRLHDSFTLQTLLSWTHER